MAPIKANLKLFLCLLVSWIFSEARAQVSPTHAGSKPHDPSSPSYRLPSKPAPPFLQRCNPLVSRSLTVLCETTNNSLHSTQQTKQLNPIHDDTILVVLKHLSSRAIFSQNVQSVIDKTFVYPKNERLYCKRT